MRRTLTELSRSETRRYATAPGVLATNLRTSFGVLKIVGEVRGELIEIPGEKPVSVASLKEAHEGLLPRYMAEMPS